MHCCAHRAIVPQSFAATQLAFPACRRDLFSAPATASNDGPLPLAKSTLSQALRCDCVESQAPPACFLKKKMKGFSSRPPMDYELVLTDGLPKEVQVLSPADLPSCQPQDIPDEAIKTFNEILSVRWNGAEAIIMDEELFLAWKARRLQSKPWWIREIETRARSVGWKVARRQCRPIGPISLGVAIPEPAPPFCFVISKKKFN